MLASSGKAQETPALPGKPLATLGLCWEQKWQRKTTSKAAEKARPRIALRHSPGPAQMPFN